MIRIKIDKTLDYKTYKEFRVFTAGGIDFGAKIRKNHPDIYHVNFKKYIDSFYKSNKQELISKKIEINKILGINEDKISSAIKGVFGSVREAKYYGFISIFNCNPRYTKTKTFQVFFKKNPPEMLQTILHEILHFIFFDYCDKKTSSAIRALDKNAGPLWEISEMFNVIVLNLPAFQHITGREEKLFYPQLEEKFLEIKEIWDKNHGNLISFIKKSLFAISS